MNALAKVTPLRSAAPAPVWLSPAQVCERIPGLTVGHLTDLRKRRKGPAFFKPTLKTVLYDVADVDAWVRASREKTRDQP